MNKILISTKYNELMFDFDTKTERLSRVKRCIHDNNNVTFNRFDYDYYPDGYREATEEDFKNYDLTCTYYSEDGSRPYKTKDCFKCDSSKECRHHQNYCKQ